MSTYDPKTTYIPILKAKSGELSALSVLKSPKGSVVPLLEVPRAKWDFVEDKLAETPKKLLDRVIPMIEKTWENQPFFLDAYNDQLISGGDEEEDGKTEVKLVDTLVESLKDKKLNFIPVISTSYTPAYNKAIVEAFSATGRGFCLRVAYNPDEVITKADYDTFLGEIGLTPESVDLIIDFGSVYKDGGEAVYLAYRMILAETPYIEAWRNIAIASSSFPKTIGGVMAKNTELLLPRGEWQGWSKLAKTKKLARLPIYSDYSVAHPEVFDDVDPRFMKIAGSIRYTTPDDWFLLKGEALTGAGAKGYSQFHELSQKIIDSKHYHKADMSWGDNFINDCANPDEKGKPKGSLAQWRQVGNSQHIDLTIQLLAKLFENA